MFFKNIHTRIKMVLLIVIFIFIIITAKVFYIQVIDYDKLNNYASSLWSRNLPIEADRGLITDRNGKVLADNITTTSLRRVLLRTIKSDLLIRILKELFNISYTLGKIKLSFFIITTTCHKINIEITEIIPSEYFLIVEFIYWKTSSHLFFKS